MRLGGQEDRIPRPVRIMITNLKKTPSVVGIPFHLVALPSNLTEKEIAQCIHSCELPEKLPFFYVQEDVPGKYKVVRIFWPQDYPYETTLLDSEFVPHQVSFPDSR